MADVKKLAESLTGLTVLEVNELKNVLKDEYGIEPAAAAVAVAGPAGGGDAPAEDAKSEYDVVLKDAGLRLVRPSRINWDGFVFYPQKCPLVLT
jgi:large subunit ribosomal protein L7/L12